ncbi:restriction endonuclease [Streptomyces sp. NPDC048659]|uniref:restriction endonuclease n=1 Tax=Streptomyces sp. NPDC048659 TaxID=3155489 RepID=UPI003438C5B9
MHINWASAVPFPEYPSTQMQEDLRRRISEATDDDLLAAYLHWTEGRVAADWFLLACDLKAEARAEQDHLARLVAPTDSPYTAKYSQARRDLHAALSEVVRIADYSSEEARHVWQKLSGMTRSDLPARYRAGTDEASWEANRLGPLKAKLTKAEGVMQSSLERHRDVMHDLAFREAAMDRFLRSEASVAIDEIHCMTPSGFEQTVAAFARRDGYQVLRDGGGARDLGADVIAVTPDGQRIVVQCKHRQGGRGKVGSPDIQTLNGTARPEHNADLVVAVTNGTFTKPAAEFARNHDIHLLDAAHLKRWGTWGEPLLSVLGLADVTCNSLAQHQLVK